MKHNQTYQVHASTSSISRHIKHNQKQTYQLEADSLSTTRHIKYNQTHQAQPETRTTHYNLSGTLVIIFIIQFFIITKVFLACLTYRNSFGLTCYKWYTVCQNHFYISTQDGCSNVKVEPHNYTSSTVDN